MMQGAIDAWGRLTGRELLGVRQSMHAWSAVESIKEAFALDATGTTALLVLNAETEAYAADFHYSVKDMLDDASGVLERVNAFAAIRKTLASPEFVGVLSSFDASLKAALEHYGCGTKQVAELLKDRSQLAYMRRDALRAVATMREDVFFAGTPSVTQMKFNHGVFLFWNVNTLLRIIGNSPDGVTLCLIRDSDEDDASHFAFAIKNGANLVLVSDKPRFDNPGQAADQSTRGGSKNLAWRMENLRFPYKMVGAWIDGKGKGTLDLPGANTLVSAQAEAIKLADMTDLPPDTQVWLAMVPELLRERYWRGASLAGKALSYTGGMIERPMELAAGYSALEMLEYKPLKFAPMTHETVKSDAVKFEVRQTFQNRWMEERYGSQVPAELLNPLPSLQLQMPERLLPQHESSEMNFQSAAVEKARNALAPRKLKEEYFGTESELKHIHQWVARENFAVMVERLALEEFERTKDDVQQWYVDAVTKNKDAILCGVASGELRLPTPPHEKETFHIAPRPTDRTMTNGIRFYPHGYPSIYYNYGLGCGVAFHSGYLRDGHRFKCAILPECAARELAHIFPACPEALAVVAGCAVGDMPVPLQHWYPQEAYHGNSILTDVDPLETVTNPWQDGFHPKVAVRFCRKGMKQLQRRLGLPVRLHWDDAEVARLKTQHESSRRWR